MNSKPGLDILFLADVRYEDGVPAALAAEIQAARRAGLRTGLMAVKGKRLGAPSMPMLPDIAALIDEGIVALVDPSVSIEVGLIVIYHPMTMAYRPTRHVPISARAVVLVLDQPAVDAAGAEQYDLKAIVDHCIAAFGRDVALAPVSGAVRDSLPRRLPERSHLVDADWTDGRDLERLFPWLTADDSAPHAPADAYLSDERILFISSNGIGLGHLTRQMAIARHLPNKLQSIFATMSLAMRVARDAGYLTHFLLYHGHIGCNTGIWNKIMKGEFFEAIAFTRPRIIVYDGTAADAALLEALAAHRDILSIWVRRPMWRAVHAAHLSDAAGFDLIVEPGELADDFDHGPTKPFQEQVLRIPPVLYLDPTARRPRDEARATLGLAPGDLAVAMQLGAGNNYDMTALRRALIDEILTHPGTIVLDIRSPIAFAPDKDPYNHPRVRAISLFPAFSDSLAFDAAVSAAGYNAFHEQIYGAIPTLFVPNEAPLMDLQLGRALYAELNGLGYCVRRSHDRYRLKEKVAALLDPTARAEIAARCRALPYSNGAIQIARYIGDHARMLRADYDVTKVD